MSNSIDVYAGKGASVEALYVSTTEQVSLRCIVFTPRHPVVPITVLFLPGWFSLLNSWRYFLPALTCRLQVIYVESREKASSRIQGSVGFSIDDLGYDLHRIVEHFNLKAGNYALAGSSMGATTILHVANQLLAAPLCLSLILPNARFYLPWYTSILKVIPTGISPTLLSLAKWYILKFKIDPGDTGHQERFMTALNAVDARKLKQSALDVYTFKLDWRQLHRIQIPCLVIGASKDKAHDQNAVTRIARELSFAEYQDLITFTESHSSASANALTSSISRMHSQRLSLLSAGSTTIVEASE